jgi:large subunit ribosomal protein L25
MEVGKLSVEIRTLQGKNEARRLRATGKVPGIIYGKALAAPLLIAVDPKALKKSLDPSKKQNTVIQLDGAGKPMMVMLKDYQYDKLRTEIEHVDLIAIDAQSDVRVRVPLILTGKPKGVTDGGQLTIAHRQVSIICKPATIPDKLEADITGLGLGDALHVSDLQLPAGVKAAMDAHEGLASIVAPRAEKVDVKAEEEATAAVTPAAGAAAAPAAGGKGAAAAPAAAAKAPEKKK